MITKQFCGIEITYDEDTYNKLEVRENSKQEALRYFTDLFGEYKANVIVANILFTHHNQGGNKYATFSEAINELGYQEISDIIYRAVQGLPAKGRIEFE